MSDNIKVVVKVRPLISREVEDKLSYRWRVDNNTLWQLDQSGQLTDVNFTFDKVYDENTKTAEVYDDIAKPIVEAAIAGFNGTIFAYGQTSSGKTYTMTGTEESPGIIPLAVLNLFELIEKKKDRDFLVRISYIEIYNETVKDLLDVEKKNIKIHEPLNGGIKVDCTEEVTSSPEEVLEYMKRGEVNRQTGSTNMNEESSRSHSIFQIIIESREHVDGVEECGCVNVSVLNLVDLAGSERAGQTGATGLRFKEGTHINRSLSSLALVIKQLSEEPIKYINYRDSKLTRILQNSLGGNAKTSIICAITPASLEETASTLQFAYRAKSIKNKPKVNAVVATSTTMIQDLTKQLCHLQAQLAAKQNLEVMLESSKNVEQELQTQIANLRRVILNGFISRRSVELGAAAGSRRKGVAPRRVTISTLHHIDEEPAPAVARFCTPALKYNPLCMLPPSSEGSGGAGSAGCGKLPTVPEEARMTTPPPRAALTQDDVIEIDSDDDSVTETRCSPYHKCYGATVTPPCVLRKNAKQAEKNLKEIVELTAREKIYSPDVVEQIEKVEKYANIISQLQEEIVALKETSKEKDSKIEKLTEKVNSTESQVNTITSVRSDLELQCREKDTKLTDLEVSHETLVKKFKSREQELLALLAEQQAPATTQCIGKPKKVDNETLNFMDMSKDISLVNSDNDSSTQDDGSSQVQELVNTLQAELAAKTQTIVQLETDIFTQKQQIESLNTSSRQLQLSIEEIKNQFANLESENLHLKHTIENLNSTIENQKENLASAAKDMESYNNTIQELQIQLTNKEHILNMKMNDHIIDSMIANEQKCIANNDNIKNIIHSLKVVVENRNKEIERLKSTLKEKKEALAEKYVLVEQIEVKDNLICTLTGEAEKLKDQLSENMSVLNNLMKVEQDMTNEIDMIKKENDILQQEKIENTIKIDSLQKLSTENKIQISNLETDKENLTRKITEQEIKEQTMASEYQQLVKENEDFMDKISKLEKDLDDKMFENESLSRILSEKEKTEQKLNISMQTLVKQTEDMNHRIDFVERLIEEKDKMFATKLDEFECNFEKAKIILRRLHGIAMKLKDSTEALPEPLGNFETVLDIIDSTVSSLDDSAKQNLLTIADLEDQLSELVTSKESEISLIKTEVEQLNNELTVQTETLTQKTLSLIEELKTTRADLEIKNEKISDLEIRLADTVKFSDEKDKETEENLNKAKLVLCTLHNIAFRLNHGIETLPDTIDDFDTLFVFFDSNLKVLDTSVTLILKVAVDMQDKLMEFTNEKESEIANFESQIERINCDMAVQTLKLSQQIFNLIEQLRTTRTELESKEGELSDLKRELTDSRAFIANLNNDLMSKESMITSLNSVLEKFKKMNINIDKLEELIETKNTQIQFLQDQLSNDANSLEDKYKDVTNALDEAIQNRDMLLAEIMKKATRVARQCGIDSNELGPNHDGNIYEQVVVILDKIGMSVAMLKTENEIERNDIERMLSLAKEEVEQLTEANVHLVNENDDLRNVNKNLLLEIEQIKKLNFESVNNNELLEQLKLELQTKSDEMKYIEAKAVEWREKFETYELDIQEQLNVLITENSKLKLSTEMESKQDIFQELTNLEENLKISSPRSLLTICCNKLVNTLQLPEPNLSNSSSSMTTSISKSSVRVENVETQTEDCDCRRLSLELEMATEEKLNLVEELDKATKDNLEILDVLKELNLANEYLLNEREEIRKEIKMLAEPAIELQKKINNHRTNLSTLTATTYAENKLLHSQLKVLKHHHTRYIHVCQRDLPAFKSQLNELMIILKENTFVDKQNTSFKRFSLPDVLDSSSTTQTFKNDSTLEGDLLMLDTNITLTTVDNTLVGPDQTCLDVTQANFDANDTACQTNDLSKFVDPYLLFSQIEILTNDNQKLSDTIDKLQQENLHLKEKMKTSIRTTAYKDAENSPIKVNGTNEDIISAATKTSLCEYCDELKAQLQNLEESLTTEIKCLYKEMETMKIEKDSIKEKYTNLTLEMPSTEALVRKLSNAEKDNMTKLQEIKKLKNDLNNKNERIKQLQDENDNLSGELMENISEADNLKKESDGLKDENSKLLEKLNHLEHLTEEYASKVSNESSCSLCATKDEIIKSLQLEQSKLNRSLSDSESSSRHNKICTLQNELHASKEDCRKITEEVATIKNHLERSNVSTCQAMDLDESMGDSNIFMNAKDLVSAAKIKNFQSLEEVTDAYVNDKMECIQFYIDNIGPANEILNENMKIIDLLSILYNKLISKHGDEVENLLNQLNDFEKLKTDLQTQLNKASTEYSKVTKELHESQNKFEAVSNTLNKIKSYIEILNQDMPNFIEEDKQSKVITVFKENILQVLDSGFGVSCANIFDLVIDILTKKHKRDLSDIIEKYTELQNQMNRAEIEFTVVNENLNQLKSQLSSKEDQYNLLKDQKDKIQEINSAVTLDIVKKEEKLKEILKISYEQFLELDMVDPIDIKTSIPITETLKLLFKKITEKNICKYNAAKEVDNLKLALKEKEDIISTLQEKLLENEKCLQIQKTIQEDLNNKYQHMVDENKTLIEKIESVSKDIDAVKKELMEKEKLVKTKNEDNTEETNIVVQECVSCSELITKLEKWRQDYEDLKAVNEMLTKEKESYAYDLEKAQDIISKKNDELDKMTSDVLVLRESMAVKECASCSELISKLEKWRQDYDHLKTVNEMLTKEKESYASDLEKTQDIISKKNDELDKMTSDILVLRESMAVKECMSCGELITKLEKWRQDYDDLKAVNEMLTKEKELYASDLAKAQDIISMKKDEFIKLDKMTSDTLVPRESNDVKECVSCSELLTKLEKWRQDYEDLKAINDMLTKEKESYASDLEKAQDIISKKKDELDKMTSDILVLRESIKDNVKMIETLTLEAKSMMEQNVQLKTQFDEKNQDCSRLEMNIKTHQKTVEIQTKMISRLKKQKEDDDMATKEKDKTIEELTEKCAALQKECDQMKDHLKTAREEVDSLKNKKDSLEAKVTELEVDLLQEGHRKRQSIDAITEASRRRRQSLHDTRRAFNDDLDEDKVEAVFKLRAKPDDLFMDVDEDSSNRSTPARLSKGRDALLARHDNEEETPSRPSSVTQTRRRRQSIHDLHRTVRHSPSTVDKNDENISDDCTDLTQLRERLEATQQELEELKERYRELDDECDTCAQYLRERDEQCRKLKKEKTALEHQLAELKLNFNLNRSEIKPSIAHAAVNTDEDWANLHSVVVDRMSFDAEVEKNKKLVRTIEELRSNKQELKNTIAKMQRALEKNAAFMHSKELDAAKSEVSACKEELAALRQRYAELDEECETCAQYLRERDQQCRALKEAKRALERKLEEIQGDVGSMAAAVRRKRHSAHDHNRPPPDTADAHTQITDDFLAHQVERDDTALRERNAQMLELKRVKMLLDKVVREKAALESQLAGAPPPAPTFFVGTGSAIVQNQQITDVMKENQKLKKMNAKLISICKKRAKDNSDRENQLPADLA